jgi:ribonuclease T2
LHSDMFALACRRGELEEVRICLSKDLAGFQSCPEVVRSGCAAESLRLPAPQ